MFRRFRPKIRVYGNRHHGCSFKATINFLIWNGRRISRATKLPSRIFEIFENSQKFSTFSTFFFLFQNFPPQYQNFPKTVTYVRGQCLMNICTKCQVKYLQKWLRYNIKHVKNRHFSRHFATLPWFSEFCFLTDFDASKGVVGSFFAFFVKIWPKNMYRSSKSRNFFVWPFSPGDLRWPWPLLWSQSTGTDTYRCQWHYPCRLVGFVCA